MLTSQTLASFDPLLWDAISSEIRRQEDHIELIASENFVSLDVLRAQGSVLTNKYAEGYPGKRYYGGCFAVDEIEKLAIARACALFGCAFANVQPHSGSQANQAVFLHRNGATQIIDPCSKLALAHHLLDFILEQASVE